MTSHNKSQLLLYPFVFNLHLNWFASFPFAHPRADTPACLLWWWISYRTFLALSNHHLFQLTLCANMIFVFSLTARNSISLDATKRPILWLFSRSAILCHIVAVLWPILLMELIFLKIDFSRLALFLHHLIRSHLRAPAETDDRNRKTHFILLFKFIFFNLLSVVGDDEIMYSITI